MSVFNFLLRTYSAQLRLRHTFWLLMGGFQLTFRLSGHCLRKWSFFVTQGGSQLTFQGTAWESDHFLFLKGGPNWPFRCLDWKLIWKITASTGSQRCRCTERLRRPRLLLALEPAPTRYLLYLKWNWRREIKLKAQIVENIKEEEVFLLDPSPIIAYPCQSRMLWRPELCDSCCWRCQLKTCWFCRFFWCWHWGYCWWLLTSTAWQEQAMFGKSLTTMFTYSFQYCLSRLRISLL